VAQASRLCFNSLVPSKSPWEHNMLIGSGFQPVVQTGNLFLVGADLCVRPGLRAHTQVRPYSIEAFLTSMSATWSYAPRMARETRPTEFSALENRPPNLKIEGNLV
jgi:hypothetical protein